MVVAIRSSGLKVHVSLVFQVDIPGDTEFSDKKDTF